MSGRMFDFIADPSTRLRPRCVASGPYGTVVYSLPAQRHALVSPWARHRCFAGSGTSAAAICVDQRAPSPSMTTPTVLNRIRISSSSVWFLT